MKTIKGLGLLVIAIACDTTPPQHVADVLIEPAAIDVGVGGSRQLVVTLRDVSGDTLTGRAIEWTSSVNAIAAVSAAGVVTGSAVGNTSIVATSEGVSGTATIRVPAPQDDMDAEVAYWIERAVGYALYNGNLLGVPTDPNGNLNVSANCPGGGTAGITGNISYDGITVQIDLRFSTHSCAVLIQSGELRITGVVLMKGSFRTTDRYENITYSTSAQDPTTIVGTVRLPTGTPFAVDQSCSLSVLRSVAATGESTLSGKMCGRAFPN